MKIPLRSRYLFQEILFFTILWIVIMQMFFMIAFWGLNYNVDNPIINDLFEKYYGFWDIMFHGFTFGILFSLINAFIDRSKFRKRSLGMIILVKTLFYIIAISIADTLLLVLNAEITQVGFKASYTYLMKNLPRDFLGAISLYYLFFILLINFLYQLNKKIGSGILFNSIIGKYHEPRDEKLIFLFIDLKNSTGIAEELEHKKYSLFIKDCFSFLTNPIYNSEANVYQYVGDEAVLIWPLKKGMENLNCLRLFFDYRRVLDEKHDYFMDRYGIFPEFKAGIDFGEVTVTEVGEIRRDLAYHGDVLNTASRLEKLCKTVGEDLLISEYLHAELNELRGYNCEFVNEFKLDGKNNLIKVYAIEEVEKSS